MSTNNNKCSTEDCKNLIHYKKAELCRSCYNLNARNMKDEEINSLRTQIESLQKEKDLLAQENSKLQFQLISTLQPVVSIPLTSNELGLVTQKILNDEKTLIYNKVSYEILLQQFLGKNFIGFDWCVICNIMPGIKEVEEKSNEHLRKAMTPSERNLVAQGLLDDPYRNGTSQITTLLNQYLYLIYHVSEDNLELKVLWDRKKINIFINFLEDIEKAPATIRNRLVSFNILLTILIEIDVFLPFKNEIMKTKTYLTNEMAPLKRQINRQPRKNFTDLIKDGDFATEKELDCFLIWLLNGFLICNKKEEKDINDYFHLQKIIFTICGILLGGQRLQVLACLRTDCIEKRERLEEQDSQYYLKLGQVEKRDRNTTLIPCKDLVGEMLLYFKNEVRLFIIKNEQIDQLWLQKSGYPIRKDKASKWLNYFSKMFNPCLSLTFMNLRRFRVSSLWERNLMNSPDFIKKVSSFLCTSKNVLINSYNRFSEPTEKIINVIVPIQTSLQEKMDKVTNIIKLNDVIENNKIERFIRENEKDEIAAFKFEEWKSQKINEFQENDNEEDDIIKIKNLSLGKCENIKFTKVNIKIIKIDENDLLDIKFIIDLKREKFDDIDKIEKKKKKFE